MIAPMTKYSFLVYHQDYLPFLEDMRNIGVLHLIERQKEVSDEMLAKYDLINKVNGVVKFLERREVEHPAPAKGLDGKTAFEELESLQLELENKHQQLSTLKKEISYAAPWGNFSPETLKKMREQGLRVKFFTVSARKFEESWLQQHPIAVVGQHAGLNYLVMILPEGEEEPKLDIEEMRAPERPISELRFYEQKLNEEIEAINKRFEQHAVESLEAIQHFLLKLKEDMHFDKVLENTVKEADEKVMLLEGWAPVERKEVLIAYLENDHILYVEEEPKDEDKVPILLKNRKFAQLHETIGKFYDLPNHRELDLVPFFAPFYTMFFGFCLGDAGYGLLIVLLATIFKRKKPKIKNLLTLAQFLGLSTIIFGILTGTFFGISLVDADIPWLENVKGFMIDNNQLFYLAIILGIVQILFGMVLKVVNITKTHGFWYSLSTIGWLILIIGLGTRYGLNTAEILSEQASSLMQYGVMITSGILILLANNPKRNLLINFGAGLWDIYVMATGLLGDLLSYLRLFALGVSTAILGMVFNSMAMNMKPDNIVLGPLVMILILVFGHAITIFMAALGAFVHPIRLTFVEFYKNAGFTGGGKEYKPFERLTLK
jgi:V/A-type H+/Na+-transporting ATPase subunit I